MSDTLARIYGLRPAALVTLAAYQLPAAGGRATLARAARRGMATAAYLEARRNHDAGRQAGRSKTMSTPTEPRCCDECGQKLDQDYAPHETTCGACLDQVPAREEPPTSRREARRNHDAGRQAGRR